MRIFLYLRIVFQILYILTMEDSMDMLVDFGPVQDTTKNIIKVVGVGGGGCNAVGNMYCEGMQSVTFAVCNTDSKSLSINPVPTKIMLGGDGYGAGADPAKGREAAEKNIEDLKHLFRDNTQMVFVAATMGGGTGTGAGPLVAKVAREMGLLTIGIVTLPFYFEHRPKIQKALKGLEEMRRNVDALLIINNEQICKVYSDSHIPAKEALKLADSVMGNAVRSISELITQPGMIQTDLADVKTTMKNGGGAIMAIGRASGEHRVREAVLDALNSPLLYGSDISKATRLLFNIYTSSDYPLYVDEIEEIDAFMDELDPNISVIWGLAEDDTLDKDAKITILATGFENSLPELTAEATTTEQLDEIIDKLYQRRKHTPKPLKPSESLDPSKPLNRPLDIDQSEAHDPLTPSEAPYEDPAKSFFNRVKNRIKDGLTMLVADDDDNN